MTCIAFVIFILFQMASCGRQTRYGNFSGEYYASGNGIGPAVIHFNDDGTGHYYIGGHMYIFDYSLSGGTISIDTHEEFLPILKGEIDVEGTYDDDSITFGNVVYHKKLLREILTNKTNYNFIYKIKSTKPIKSLMLFYFIRTFPQEPHSHVP